MKPATEIYAVLLSNNDKEWIVADRTVSTTMPFVILDERRLGWLKELAQNAASRTGKRLCLAKFLVREDIEFFEPAKESSDV